MHAWQIWLDRKSVAWLSKAAIGCAATGTLTLAWSFWAEQLWSTPITLPLSAVAWLCYWAVKRAVERGLAAERWSDAARTGVKQKIRKLSLWLLPFWLVMLVVQITRTWSHHHHGNPTAMIWMPIWLFSQATAALTRMINPRVAPAARTALFADMKPIRSEHWGERITQG